VYQPTKTMELDLVVVRVHFVPHTLFVLLVKEAVHVDLPLQVKNR
jgi:hypothetical protein